MEECDSQSRAKLFERSLPKVFRGLRGANGARHGIDILNLIILRRRRNEAFYDLDN